MNKFIIKYLIIFTSIISFMFFSLTGFHQYKMEIKDENFNIRNNDTEIDIASPQPPPQNPPTSIPLIFIILVSSVFTYIVLRNIHKNYVKPLTDIQDGVKKIKNGNLETRFEAMSESKAVKETNLALNEMVETIQEKEKLQDDFIRSIIHDLRAPIVAQERAMEILNEEMQDNELVKGLMENNNTYLKLVNGIIDTFSQREIVIEKTTFNLNKLLDSIFTALESLFDSKNIKLIRHVDHNFMVWSDYISLNRIIMNLIYNALENIDCGKVITIRAIHNEKSDNIIIEDNGKGLNRAQISTLFTRHIKRSELENKLISGIGLSIVHDLVVQNDGTINVESEENLYTRFTIELPKFEKHEEN